MRTIDAFCNKGCHGLTLGRAPRWITSPYSPPRSTSKTSNNPRTVKMDRLGCGVVATKMPSMTEPSGYVLEPLREGPDFTLYRGRQHGNPSPVLAVGLAAEQPSPQTLRRIEHEYSLAAELDSAWAAKPLALIRHEGRTILVLKDSGGEPLDRILERDQGQPLDLNRFLRIAIALATALGQVHRHGLIHKDIKPGNVLVDVADDVWLTGFGIASKLPNERQVPAPPEIIAGTLAYMAPEQTGRMNRSIDARSDLYSLGVTLYQMLTGVLPFAAVDPLEWVHCHIARHPTPLSDRAAVPEPLSAIIMKLLAKNAEERYQTASGLEADLRRCLEEWQARGRINTFPMGAHDFSDRLLIPEKLYGREREVDALLAAFDRVVAQGTPELVLVSGYSGVGKSSVVNELHKVLVPPRGLFASGKFDQYKRDIPYATLAQAFQMLVRQILVKNEVEVGHWRHALQEAVGPNGQLIINLIPEVEFIIGKQPPVPDLPPQDARNRFQLVFRRFLGEFARPEHPLALFLDDLQWLDAATLELLERLITDRDVRHLMLVGAYRDNEVGSSHPLTQTLGAIRKAGARMLEIVLAPLVLDDVGWLVADALHCDLERARPLAQLVQEKTGGNPFFAIQFLTALAEEGLLAFDSVTLAWQWDIDRIRAKSYTDNVVDLMADKLRRLPTPTQEALKQLACLGNFAEIATLTMVRGETEDATHAALWEAVRAGIVFRQESAYKFLHDRIQQAAYTLIREEHRAELHLGIGRVLLASITADGLAEHLFDVANQLNRSAALLIDRDEKVRVATIDLRAGRKAKASAAYASARAYFAAGMALLEERNWASQYDLTFSLWLERAECELLSGNFEKAEQLILELLQRAASKADQAAVYRLKVQFHVMESENEQAVASALTCLRMFGIDMPTHPTFEQVQAEYETVWQTLGARPIESLIELPLMTDPEMQAAMQVFSVLPAPAYFTDFHLYCLQSCRMVKVSMQYGTSGPSAHSYACLALMLGPAFHRYRDAYRFAKLACDLVERHGFIAYHAKVRYGMGTVAFWTQPIATAIDFMRTTFRAGIEAGDLTFACYGMFQSVTGLLLRNDPLDAVWRESEIALDFAREAKYADAADIIGSQQRFIATMQGRTANFSTFSDVQFDEAAFEAQLTADRMTLMICWYWMLKLKARYLSRDYVEALAAADKAKALLPFAAAQIQLVDYFFYAALTVAACFDDAAADQQQAWRQLLTTHREQLREWADTNPPTFADKLTLVSAEIARLEKRDADAMRLYEQAIHVAREHGFVQNEGLAHEVAARFYSSRGFETIAHTYLGNARNCYDRWGALGKVKQLDERYPHLREGPISPTAATIGTPVGQLDVETVVKASQALSSEIVLDKLIEKLMRIAVEHAGAERGLLILLRGDELKIEAEATTGHGSVQVIVRQATVTPSDLPQSALHYVIRTRARVVLDDVSVGNLYSEDEYVRQKRPRSVLCLPIVEQTKLVGILYLENNLTPCAFTSDRVAVLELLASQAAISLENATLYSDLQREEQNFRLIVDTVPGLLCTMTARGEVEFVNQGILDYTGWTLEELADWRPLIHPDDLAMVMTRWTRSVQTGHPYDIEHRIRGADGVYRWFHVRGLPLRDTEGRIVRWYNLITDIDERRKTHEKLQRSEAFLAEGQSISHTGSFGWNVPSGEIYWSEETYNIFEHDRAAKPTLDLVVQRTHPDDRDLVQQILEHATREKTDFDIEHRLLMPDGRVKQIHVLARAFEPSSGNLEYVGALSDVTAAKQAEEKIRQSEVELRQIMELAPQQVAVLGPDRSRLYVNQAGLDYHGLSLKEWQSCHPDRIVHPDDWERAMSETQSKFLSGIPCEAQARLLRKDGQYRWFLFRCNPLRDEQGRPSRWYVAAMDIEDRKQAEQRLHDENVALREEVDKASMFEEIVGTSPPLQTVLSLISRVAPTDSSVLITGETGTGKELVARAIHKGSRRSSRAFVCVNCAAIPRELIASELFGHEKGAFTGATQRRLGRFELAEGGTIFLDEIGELPAETQVALLRVLQDHEFERVGGTGSIRNDVRVIAATNRDLEAAIASGIFRSDLFYRLNVFPIEMPPLRERTEDIPLLVGYFMERYSRKVGKSFQKVNKRSLDLLQAYPWPGNIRELQNVIERSLIISSGDILSVEESWVSKESSQPPSQVQVPRPIEGEPQGEREIIEAALAESRGRVSGPLGAAAKLGIPRSTLESRIKALKIRKTRFKFD
jgi:PAS domain S-box-containing protein